MLRKLIGEKIYCGLDIGSHSIKAGVIKGADLDCMELLGVFESRTSGFKDSSVSDLGALTECIHKTIGGLTKKTGVKLKEVQVGVGGHLIDNRINSTVIPLLDRGSKVIGARDIKKINNQSRVLGIKVEEEILHNFPQFYRVDDVNTALNPMGLFGRKLEVNSLLLVANITRMKNITKAINQAGFEVSNLFFSSYAASAASLDRNHHKEGCVLIDIGAEGIDVLIFKNGQLNYLDRIPLGGERITLSIAQHLNLPFELAEDIKKSYAIATVEEKRNEEEILVKRNSNYIPIKRQDIFDSIDSEVSKIISAISKSLSGSHLLQDINGGIIMVGGGSLLTGLIERIENELNLNVKIGEVKVGPRGMHNAPIFSAVVGLAKLRLNQSLKMSLSSNGQKPWAPYVMNRLKEFYQEYF